MFGIQVHKSLFAVTLLLLLLGLPPTSAWQETSSTAQPPLPPGAALAMQEFDATVIDTCDE